MVLSSLFQIRPSKFGGSFNDHRNRYNSPKGRHDAIKKGYLCIELKSATVWKSIIQTPYEASLPVNQITDLVKTGIDAIRGELNIDTRLKTEYNGKYYDFGNNNEGYKANGMYRWQYKANYRTGLWELEIYTTKSLKIPENRRPHLKVGKK